MLEAERDKSGVVYVCMLYCAVCDACSTLHLCVEMLSVRSVFSTADVGSTGETSNLSFEMTEADL